jgi:DNA-binding transcriptional regulator YiaG
MRDDRCHQRPGQSPLTAERLSRMRRVSRARFVRRKLGLSLEQFSASYGIPVEILRGWERHQTVPNVVESAYLDAILKAPDAIRRPAAA